MFDLAPFLEGGKAKCGRCGNVPILDRPTAPGTAVREAAGILIPHGSTPPLDICLLCGGKQGVQVKPVTLDWIPKKALLIGLASGPAGANLAGAFLSRSATVLLPECSACRASLRSRTVLLYVLGALCLPVVLFLVLVLGSLVSSVIRFPASWGDQVFIVAVLVGFVAWGGLLLALVEARSRRRWQCSRIDDAGVLLHLPLHPPG
ncbi:MAG: hypothetical protein IT452_19845 [Planctomycetia bacterium]|nr:hypothetical protein [Planctomycetia bacterium]